jgi:hypothetical protein
MFRCLRLGAALSACNQQQCSIHSSSSIKHGGHENIVTLEANVMVRTRQIQQDTISYPKGTKKSFGSDNWYMYWFLLMHSISAANGEGKTRGCIYTWNLSNSWVTYRAINKWHMVQQLHSGTLKIRNNTECAILLSTPISPATTIAHLTQLHIRCHLGSKQTQGKSPRKSTNKETFTSFSYLHRPDFSRLSNNTRKPHENY